jgi:hypothetical protein
VFFSETVDIAQRFLALKTRWIWCVALAKSSCLGSVNVTNVFHEKKVGGVIGLAPAALGEHDGVLLSNVKGQVLFNVKLSVTTGSKGALISLLTD